MGALLVLMNIIALNVKEFRIKIIDYLFMNNVNASKDSFKIKIKKIVQVIIYQLIKVY